MSQVRHAEEDQVKAAYLFNFAKFVDWPAESFPGSTDPIVICSIGDDRLAEILQQVVRGKQAQGRPVEARQMGAGGQFKACHILLIGFAGQLQILPILHSIRDCCVLTVGEGGDFAHLGGMINLVHNNGNIELEINLKAAEAANLKISSRLLAIAHVVNEHHGGGGL